MKIWDEPNTGLFEKLTEVKVIQYCSVCNIDTNSFRSKISQFKFDFLLPKGGGGVLFSQHRQLSNGTKKFSIKRFLNNWDKNAHIKYTDHKSKHIKVTDKWTSLTCFQSFLFAMALRRQ